jgi:DNA-binding NarL/FixJ family response regulator
VAPSVLVVDDDPSFSSLAARILHRAGLEVVGTAPDAATAVAAAWSLQPDAALVDVSLPDRDGFDLAQELATLPWRPRVVLTSSDRDAASRIGPARADNGLPFVPKEELATAPLLRLLGHG